MPKKAKDWYPRGEKRRNELHDHGIFCGERQNLQKYPRIYIEKIGWIKKKQAWGGGGDTMGNDY